MMHLTVFVGTNFSEEEFFDEAQKQDVVEKAQNLLRDKVKGVQIVNPNAFSGTIGVLIHETQLGILLKALVDLEEGAHVEDNDGGQLWGAVA